ncbi:hypothetical protein SPRG_11765 [Saprolegnia parasitica CBS 223.65]|uniref:Glycoside hydrolase family 5 domain-containing protein n=1 Tax=Saprolegnia parasitica (strain CBS 223.65) TaxID=695850 RepID=A0A067C8P7_SAPPC|nr:hypothetical protein SPRG_11765 [Saprolegnia parasitica CBS 223.65]KDO22921.1 hypothetical protein SPRG_11765 [Saprolegnia parasitica CBS 223.65]|eukprot:XP_012206358.1 hypothetical protein SPRG_11765 [Saprolegnia parasitica CBS 223.65]
MEPNMGPSDGWYNDNNDGADDQALRSGSFAYSERASSFTANSAAFSRGSILQRDIKATPVDTGRSWGTRYGGRLRRWPGVVLLAVIVGASVAAITYGAAASREAARTRAFDVQKRLALERAIADGTTSGSNVDDVDVADDGQVNNPEVYPPSGCQLPNYVSKNGKIYAVATNGTEVPIQIKGVNWFGMETGMRAPFGLWDNDQNGTTVYAVAQFLANNKFNSVRMPLCVSSILGNKAPEVSIINRVTNRALDLTSYLGLLQTVTQSLGYRQISVMISMHTLDIYNREGSLWYGKTLSTDDFLKAIDMLTVALCSDTYWNVLGIDVKNEPWEGTWGTGLKTISARPPSSLARASSRAHTIVLDGQEYGYYDWFGGGLHKAGAFPVVLPTPEKLVYAPHYYTPAVFPQYYLFGGGKVGKGNAINGYVELDDEKLLGRVANTMYDMFGYLNAKQDAAVVLGEFAGLYTKDEHPMKTTQRCTDFTIRAILSESYAGGYMWSLNPESAYQYNPADTPGNYVEGLLNLDWRSVNAPFLKAMKPLDAMPHLKMMPCFRT